MTNQKIEKIDELITKTKKIILKQQTRLRELERTRIILENAEIVARFRGSNITEDDLATIVRQKSGQAVQGVMASKYDVESEDANE